MIHFSWMTFENVDLLIYTVIAPRTIRPNSRYNVGVSVDSKNPVRVLVYLTATINSRLASTSNEERVIDPGTSSTITLAVGDLINGATYNLTVQGTDGLRFQNSTELTTNSKAASIFIQTDKPIYKPGEVLQFRVLLLDRLLRPYGPGPIDITIKDSQLNIIKKFNSASLQRGIFTSELQLSSEPNLGDWTIEVSFKTQKESRKFTIAEYVLPKFNVDVELPNYATFNESKIVARVRASYTYGKPVKGELVVAAYPTIHSTYIQPVFNGISRKTVPIDGVADVEFDLTKELGLTDDYQRLINVEATVKESFTGRSQNISKTIILHKYNYKVELIRGHDSFKPGLPYTVTIKVATQDDVPIRDTNPSALQIKYGFSYNHEEYATNYYAIPPNGLVTVTIQAPANSSLNALGMEATYKELTEWFSTVQRALSPSNTYIQAEVLTQNPRVNEEIEVQVDATASFTLLNYQVLGRGDLILSRVMALPSPVTKTVLRVRLPQLASPQATLICYIVHDGEVVADSLQFQVGGAIDNFLNVTLTKETEPGKEIDILLSTKPNSIVGLKAIDQSVLLLKEDKDLTISSLENELNSWNYEKENGFRFKRSLFAPIGSSTASQVFEDSGVIIMTNALVHHQPPAEVTEDKIANSRPRRPFVQIENSSLRPDIGPAIPYQIRTRPPLAGPYAFSRIPKSRLKFPRIFFGHTKYVPAPTWIFQNSTTGFDGKATIKKTVPDTITSWIISGFSLDSQYGLGVLEIPQKLKVFRPFFISLNVPYSVVKGEIVGIQVLVHNYLTRDVTAEVTLENGNNQFTFTTDDNEVETKLELFKMERIAVKANSVASLSFLITPTILGPIDINVKARTRIAGDSISRPLLVRPPGQLQKVNSASLVDLRSGRPFKTNLTTRFPPKRVADSDSVKISIVGDILGPAISNLDKLLEMPTGCGEQNMIHFVPDILVLEYLQTIRQLDDGIRAKAMNFLETGYQRELSYKHDDGSFSAFGSADPSGSTWLTAFVARSFIAAKRHIFIEKEIIEKALEWLISKQERNGAFPEVGRIFDTDIQGGSSGTTNPIALTAYVTLAFIEAENDRDLIDITSNGKFSLAKNLAMDYLVKELQGLEDPYALSLIAYVLQLSSHPFRENAFNILESKAITSENGDMKHWERQKTEIDEKNPWTRTPKPVAVETTSYALLTYVHRNLLADALPLVRWLFNQRNERGGFISTQDTVVGLTGLSKFAAATWSGNTDMNIELIHAGGSHNIKLNSNNAIVLEEIKLPSNTEWVQVNAAGTGIGIVQLSWSYNIDAAGPWPLFNVDPQVDKTSNANQLHLSVCTHSTYEDTNMAVMELNVPTGFSLNTDRLPNLLHYPQIKRYETEDSDSKLIVYFDSLNKSEVCPTVSAYRVFPVAKQAPTYVSVYDYYDNSRRARQFYSPPTTKICDICEEAQCSDECRVARLAEDENARSPNEISSAISINNKMLKTIFITLILSSVTFILTIN